LHTHIIIEIPQSQEGEEKKLPEIFAEFMQSLESRRIEREREGGGIIGGRIREGER